LESLELVFVYQHQPPLEALSFGRSAVMPFGGFHPFEGLLTVIGAINLCSLLA
jgi:hypothetical protein